MLDFSRKTFLQIFVCMGIAGAFLYASIYRQNALTELQLAIPALEKELNEIQEENIRLRYEINQFESPVHLLDLAQKPEFSHLKYPTVDKIITVQKP